MDISFPNFPCIVLSLDQQDIVGSHSVNIEGDLVKTKLDSKGRKIGKMNGVWRDTMLLERRSSKVGIDKNQPTA